MHTSFRPVATALSYLERSANSASACLSSCLQGKSNSWPKAPARRPDTSTSTLDAPHSSGDATSLPLNAPRAHCGDILPFFVPLTQLHSILTTASSAVLSADGTCLCPTWWPIHRACYTPFLRFLCILFSLLLGYHASFSGRA